MTAARTASARQSIARVVSILGHPAVLVPVAAIWVAISEAAPAATVQRLVLMAAGLAVFVTAYSLIKVRSGAWQHVDASRRSERRSLNLLLILLLQGPQRSAGAALTLRICRSLSD